MLYENLGASVTIKQADFVSLSIFASEENLADSLINYNEDANVAIVDERAPLWYAKWASLHEAFCRGEATEICGEHLPEKGNKCRCREVERILLTKMPPEYRNEYRRKRIAMFKTLLRLNLTPDLDDSFRESLKFLQE